MIVVNSDTTMIAWVVPVVLECLNIAMVPRQLESSAAMLEQDELYADTAVTLNDEFILLSLEGCRTIVWETSWECNSALLLR